MPHCCSCIVEFVAFVALRSLNYFCRRSSCCCPRMIGRSRRPSLRRMCRSDIGRMERMHWRCALHKFRYPVCNKRSNVHFRQPSWRRSRNNSCSGRRAQTGIGRCSSTMSPHFSSPRNSTHIDTALRYHISACICCRRARNPPRNLCKRHPPRPRTGVIHRRDRRDQYMPVCTVCSSACHLPLFHLRNTLRRHTS